MTGQVSSVNFSESEASGTESAGSHMLHKSAGAKSGKHSLGSDVSTTATDAPWAPDPSAIPLPPGLHGRLVDPPPGGVREGVSPDAAAQVDSKDADGLVDLAVAAYMAQLKSEARTKAPEVVAPMVLALDRLRDAMYKVQTASAQFQFVWQQAQMMHRQNTEYIWSQVAHSLLLAQQLHKAGLGVDPATFLSTTLESINQGRKDADSLGFAPTSPADSFDTEALRRLLATMPGGAAVPPVPPVPPPQPPQVAASVPPCSVVALCAPAPTSSPPAELDPAVIQEVFPCAAAPADGCVTGGFGAAKGQAADAPTDSRGNGSAADGTPALRLADLMESQASQLPTGTDERNSPKSTPAAQDEHETLRTHLQYLQTKDPARCFIVRKINRLGFESPRILKKHFMQFGPVETVLVAHSHVRCHGHSVGARLRPSGIGFVLMEKAEDAQAILAMGSTRTVQNQVIALCPFNKKPIGASEDEFQ